MYARSIECGGAISSVFAWPDEQVIDRTRAEYRVRARMNHAIEPATHAEFEIGPGKLVLREDQRRGDYKSDRKQSGYRTLQPSAELLRRLRKISYVEIVTHDLVAPTHGRGWT